MAVYSYTTSSQEETALDWLLARENEKRARLTPPQGAITKAQLFDVGTRRLWVQYYGEERDADREALRKAFSEAPAAQQDTVRTTLGPYIKEGR